MSFSSKNFLFRCGLLTNALRTAGFFRYFLCCAIMANKLICSKCNHTFVENICIPRKNRYN